MALLYQYIQHYLFGYYFLFMQLVNGTQFLNITLFLLVGAAAVPVFLTDIFPLTSICITVIT